MTRKLLETVLRRSERGAKEIKLYLSLFDRGVPVTWTNKAGISFSFSPRFGISRMGNWGNNG